MSTTVTSKGQVTIPKRVREQLGIVPGSAVDFEAGPDGSVVLVKKGGAGKRRALVFAARHFLSRLPTLPPCRFDVVAFTGEAPPEWLKNAFDDMG